MKVLGLSITRAKTLAVQTKAAPASLVPISSRGWWSLVREPFTGAWQQNQEIRSDTVLSYFAVYACITLIASDIGKLCLRLVQQDANGIWNEAESASFSPVLRKPNRYQTINKFVEQWIVSKLIWGNAYILKVRDNRRVVVSMFVLDPNRVTPLIAADGSVFYELKRDDLSDLPGEAIRVPASEIIHDRMVELYHPLVGVSPIYACGLAALQGLAIQTDSHTFFGNGSKPSGVLKIPGAITKEQADTISTSWATNYAGDNAGKVALLTEGMEYQSISMSAHDAQLIDQLKWTAENVCSCFHVPPYLVDIGPPPPYANFEPLLLKYHSQCIQSLTTNLENSLDEGLGIHEKVDGKQYGTEFNIDDLIWMDTNTRVTAAGAAIGSGALSPNEGRKKYYGLGPVNGGESPMVQQQYYSLAALSARDAGDPFAKPQPPTHEVTPTANPDDSKKFDWAAIRLAVSLKAAELTT